jgi:hypothetical protein
MLILYGLGNKVMDGDCQNAYIEYEKHPVHDSSFISPKVIL